MEENKYYIPEISEFHVGFYFEFQHWNGSKDEWIQSNDFAETFGDDDVDCISNLNIYIINNKVRVKYLDQSDIESLGFIKTFKNQWIGWNDYYLNTISGEYGYFLHATLHFPKGYIKSKRLEDNFFRIIVHRYYNSEEDSTTSIDKMLDDNESEIVYQGLINNKSELKRLLIKLGINEAK
jgi:hypothetical protein